MRKNLLLVGMSLLTVFGVSAYDFEAKDSNGSTIYYNKNADNKSVSVTYKEENVASYKGAIYIPSKVTNAGTSYNVTAIGQEAFYSCSDLVKVTIPSSVTEIGDMAFAYTGLVSLTLPESITSIGSSAFSGSAITAINIPESVTELGSYAFSYCSNLKEITLPESITDIPRSTFYECTDLAKVTILGDVKTIAREAFYSCSSLTNILLPTSVETIGQDAFNWCSSLKDIKIPNSVTRIEDTAFGSCYALETVTLPRYLEYLGNMAFIDCSALKTVTNKNNKPSTTTMGLYPFDNIDLSKCKLIVPNGSYDLYKAANWWKEFGTITTAPNYDFSASNGGSKIYYLINADGVSVSVTYSSIEGNSYAGSIKIPEKVSYNGVSYSVTGIDDYAFNGCTSLTSIEMPEQLNPPTPTITYIGKRAFFGCSGLTTIRTPYGVTTIGEEAFRGCSSATEILLANTVKNIGDAALQSCSSLKRIVVPEGVNTIPESFAYKCTALEEVVLPRSLSDIGYHAFWECNNIMKIVSRCANPPSLTMKFAFEALSTNAELWVPEGTKDNYTKAGGWSVPNKFLPHYDFQENGIYYLMYPGGATKVFVTYGDDYNSYSGNVMIYEYVYREGYPYKVAVIGNRAFHKCAELISVRIPNTVTLIQSEAFSYSTKLNNVVIPNSVTSIMENAFAYCSGLENLEMSNSVEHIWENAFLNCSKLKNITLPATLMKLDSGAFYACSSLESVTSKNEDPANIQLGENVFKVVPVIDCILYVPADSKALYAGADQWKEFTHIKSITGEVVKGDANGDGEVTITDLSYVIDYLLEKGHSDFDKDAADVNGDGQITLSDLSAIITIILAK